MIALTQEKREELIERYNQQIITFKYHLSQIGQEHFDGKAYAEMLLKTEIALAALTAKSVLHAVDNDVEDKIYTALCNENEDGAYPLFTAPPVPEIKLPDGYALVPIEPTEDMVIAGFESKPSAFNSSTEELEKCEAMSGCEEAAHRAKLCWKAMINSAPDVNGLGE